jgi:hypothetical protein
MMRMLTSSPQTGAGSDARTGVDAPLGYWDEHL